MGPVSLDWGTVCVGWGWVEATSVVSSGCKRVEKASVFDSSGRASHGAVAAATFPLRPVYVCYQSHPRDATTPSSSHWTPTTTAALSQRRQFIGWLWFFSPFFLCACVRARVCVCACVCVSAHPLGANSFFGLFFSALTLIFLLASALRGCVCKVCEVALKWVKAPPETENSLQRPTGWGCVLRAAVAVFLCYD